jgi:multidrug efflux pump subunit AcrA (membrane-fusion protein)
MYADVIFDSRGNKNALAVPPAAVVTSTEAKYVIVVRNGRTVKVNVSTGNENSGWVEITGAVQAGDTVIAQANDEIKEGVSIQ